MADSHGDAERIGAAAAHFRAHGCALCIHLGDIGDTNRPETMAACLEQLTTHRILAIRGNNDHALLMSPSTWIKPEIRKAIRAMPLTRVIGSALLAHSLPSDAGLGPRCMLEDMHAGHIRHFFQAYPGRQLFRGHRHRPEIIRPQGGAHLREDLLTKRHYALNKRLPAIVTCGALADGLCLLWDRREETIRLISLGGH